MRPFQLNRMKLRESELPLSLLFNEVFDSVERFDEKSRLKIRPVTFMLYRDHPTPGGHLVRYFPSECSKNE